MGLATPGTGSRPCHSSCPDLASKARRYASIAPVKTSPPAVMATPLTSGVPQWKAMPSGARSSVVPTRERQIIFPPLRSTATISPHGGLLHNRPSGESASARVIANGAPCCWPKSWPGGGLKPLASSRRITLTVGPAALVVGEGILLAGTNAAAPPFPPAAGHRKLQRALR